MGQYHKLINYTKREIVIPHKVGDGLKLREWSDLGMLRAMQALLAVSNGRGGGDLLNYKTVVGRWAGDKIAIVGDYAEKGDLPWAKTKDPNYMFDKEGGLKDGWTDISEEVSVYLQEICEYSFKNLDGWRQRVMKGEEVASRMSPDMVVSK